MTIICYIDISSISLFLTLNFARTLLITACGYISSISFIIYFPTQNVEEYLAAISSTKSTKIVSEPLIYRAFLYLELLRVHLFGHLLLPHLSYCPGSLLLFGPAEALTRQQVIKVGI